MKIVLIYRAENKRNLEISRKILDILEKTKHEIIKIGLNNKEILEKEISNSSVVIVVGGDGTIMHVAKICARHDKLILGVNSGKLGFLANFTEFDLYKIPKILENKYENIPVLKRMMFEVEIPEKSQSLQVFNEIVISRDLKSHIVNFRLSQDYKKVCEYSADGIIIATPSGSTAYSLSAGGPVVDPQINCAIVTPICAHSLTARSFILDPCKEITVNYELKNDSGIYISIDGYISHISIENSHIIIKKSDLFSKFINLNDTNIYQKLNKIY